MEFKESYFKESSESGSEANVAGGDEDEDLVKGLQFMPDVDDVLEAEQEEGASSRAGLLGKAQALVASEVMTHTMSSIMANTMSGLSYLGDTVRVAAGGAPSSDTPSSGQTVHYKADNEALNVQASGTNTNTNSRGSTGKLVESVDSDTLLADFEFLDQEDLNVMEDEDKQQKSSEK